MFDFEKGRIKFILGERYPHCHTVFVDDDIRAVIDAASREDALKAIHRERPIGILIVSHGHEDHIMYNYLFPDAEFWVHEIDAPVFLHIDHLLDCYSPTEEERVKWTELLIEICHYQVRQPARLLTHGDILNFGHTSCRVIHTPGHTPGHCAFHFLEERTLFLGDLDLVKSGPYYGDVESSLEDTIDSLERLANVDADIYLTAHGKGIYEADPELIYQYLETIKSREERLLEFLSEGPKTLDEVTRKGIIYGPPKVVAGYWDLSTSERSMMSKHLDRLKDQGRVYMEGGRYYLRT
ncbi:MAG: MBL fold metallo-hydrolase [Pseudomonadota bacterium]